MSPSKVNQHTLSAVVLALSMAACGGGDSSHPAPTVTATSSPTITDMPTRTATPIPPTATASATATATYTATTIPAEALQIVKPQANQLSLSGDVEIAMTLPEIIAFDACFAVTARVDDTPVPLILAAGVTRGVASGLSAGQHVVTFHITLPGCSTTDRQATFETIALDRPDVCEILNNAECLYPYPSSRFLEPADTPTGYRLNLPQAGMLMQNNRPIPVAPYNLNDGFSPTVQILMNFPGGVDVERSNASRLLAATRTYDARSLAADSPTVLLDADTGERILHFVENDVRATDVSRQTFFLRPGKSLTPGHRYIVAVRHLVHSDGSAVVAEAPFAALRDARASDIAALNARRSQFADIFSKLATAGIERSSLILAFDFVVASDQGLTNQMLSMRDQTFAWLAQAAASQSKTFHVEHVTENDCTQSGTVAWRVIEGTYQVPLFLKNDPVLAAVTPAFLNVDSTGTPLQNGFTNPPFTIAIPCAALDNGGSPKRTLILGHGLFGDGRGFVQSIVEASDGNIDLIAGATDWRGLSAPDIAGDDLTRTFIGRVILQLPNFPAMPDRLRQGQLNTLTLTRMMKSGMFNQDEAFKLPSGDGAFAVDEEAFYLGGSLGGIMGLMFAALSPDVVNVDVVVPAMNFSLLLQRATPFLAFQSAFELGGIRDPMQQALLLTVIHELWVRGESAGYVTHITSNPLAGTNTKHVLMTSAYLDQQVSNQGTEIAARTLGLPSLIGSLQSNLVQIPDLPGPLPSALVMYDTGAFDITNPAHQPFIPPLSNLQAEPNRCDPHGRQAFIPAALSQIEGFLQPGGVIQNFCNGICDADGPNELPDGASERCKPVD